LLLQPTAQHVLLEHTLLLLLLLQPTTALHVWLGRFLLDQEPHQWLTAQSVLLEHTLLLLLLQPTALHVWQVPSVMQAQVAILLCVQLAITAQPLLMQLCAMLVTTAHQAQPNRLHAPLVPSVLQAQVAILLCVQLVITAQPLLLQLCAMLVTTAHPPAQPNKPFVLLASTAQCQRTKASALLAFIAHQVVQARPYVLLGFTAHQAQSNRLHAQQAPTVLSTMRPQLSAIRAITA
jgi:hypothetical protein